MQYPAPEQTHELDISLLTALSSSIGFQYPQDAAYYNLFIDVLTFSRVARQELQLTLVSTDEVVRELIEHYPAMLPPNADIKIEPLADVMGHEPSLTQVMSNLLTNAVKFVAPGQLPEVRVWTKKHGLEVRILVEDNGIGISPQYQHRLFRMFERIHPDLDYEGTGVGLAIVRKAAERMNGTVGMESDGKTGSRFWVQLTGVHSTETAIT